MLDPLLAREPRVQLVACDLQRCARYGVRELSATFHGRDVFAPLAAALASGKCTVGDFGREVERPAAPRRAKSPRVGVVAVVDRFGNLITDIEAVALAGLTAPRVELAGREFAVRRTYGDVAAGEYVALVNSFGTLEVARSAASAAAGLGVGVGTPAELVGDPA